MTRATTTTEENSYLEQFERARARQLEGEPEWLRSLRENAIESFESLGFPQPRDEAWRFTNVSRLTRTAFTAPRRVAALNGAEKRLRAVEPFGTSSGGRLVFVDGFYRPELSRAPARRQGVRLVALAEALRTDDLAHMLETRLGCGEAHRRHAFSALSTAFFSDGAVLCVDDGVTLEEPVHVVFIATADAPAVSSSTRLLAILGKDSHATLVESYVAAGQNEYLTNSVGEMLLESGASLEHTKFQDENLAAYHVASTWARLASSSRYSMHSFSLGAALTRNDIEVLLDGEGIDSHLNGLYLPRGSQHVDNHTRIVHAKPHCHSFELYKGVLDERSSAVFNGRIFVAEGAQKTDAKQSNKNLLLSEDATVNANPELEIFADDVRCTHGATIGNIDEDQLFYLRARGIDERIARGILTYGFASEVVDLIQDEPIREEIGARLFPHLPREARMAIGGAD